MQAELKITRELLDRFFEGGQCSEAELLLIQKHLEEGGAVLEEVVIDKLELAFQQKDIKPSPYKDALFRKINGTPQSLLLRIAVAASILLVLGVGAKWFFDSREPKQVVLPAMEMVTAQTGAGQIMQLELPDGSSVTLNSNTRLVYPAAFKDSERVVQLEGEAYFAVAKDAAHPFMVKTARLSTRVLGTEFAVLAYPNEVVHRVAVEGGRVAVAAGKALEILTAGTAVTFGNAGPVPTAAPRSAFAWRTGELDFNNQTLAEVVLALSHYYGVPILLGSEKMGQLRVTTHFENTSLEMALKTIGQLYDLQVVGDPRTGYRLQ